MALKENPVANATLSHYCASRRTTLNSDASSYGLGAILLQWQNNEEWHPVAYIARAMTPTEQRYEQIEKEAIAISRARERFADYLIGLQYHIEIDHKPLVYAVADYEEP